MPEAAGDSGAQQAHAARVLAVAERILARLESSPESSPQKRNLWLLEASFLARLAAAFLLDPEFPALPEGWDRLLDLDRARRAARQFARPSSRQLSFTRKNEEPTPSDRKTSLPVMEIDRRLAAQTAATIRELHATRLDLFTEYLRLECDSEVECASLALVDRYWQSHQRLIEIASERPKKPKPPRTRRGKAAQLHPPLWKHDVTWEFWRRLDQRFLFWSDPVPEAKSPALSQEL